MEIHKITVTNLQDILTAKPEIKLDELSFPTSNERYPQRVDRLLSEIEVDRYVGVCGGGTQNLYLLSLLQAKNGLSKVVFVDREIKQLRNFLDLAALFNDSKSMESYESGIKRRVNASMHSSYIGVPNFVKTNIRRPALKSDLEVELKFSNIDDYIEGLSDEGRYFIYLSNIYQLGWLGYENTESLLDEISESDTFEPGSVVFMSRHDDKEDEFNSYNSAIILRKTESGGLLSLNREKKIKFQFDREIKVSGYKRLF